MIRIALFGLDTCSDILYKELRNFNTGNYYVGRNNNQEYDYIKFMAKTARSVSQPVDNNHAKCLRPLLKPNQPIGPVRPVPPVPYSLRPVTHVTVKHHYCILSNACVPNNVSPLSLVLVKPFNMRFLGTSAFELPYKTLIISAHVILCIYLRNYLCSFPLSQKCPKLNMAVPKQTFLQKQIARFVKSPHLRGYKLLISLFNTPILEPDSKAMTPLEQHSTKRKCGRLKNGLHVYNKNVSVKSPYESVCDAITQNTKTLNGYDTLEGTVYTFLKFTARLRMFCYDLRLTLDVNIAQIIPIQV
ncbi:uncharacterized protein EV154DRAFT_488914 [Mucor mucedo]|uniref:uncharacterized protein n=1 Tax=Mucor mucedo TaxID=29922 RepID=UPI00221E3984|nr:uncharacterized protein EV154DRAFT_488914 [Mucor mucedo]KAI7864378.1 hypothetical protein EV154DRAFT_488914 [Mucor mucedo]